MRQLNFPKYLFRFKNSENKIAIFDEIRKKFIILTPEEWVRQHVVRFLIDECNYPISLINIEKTLKINDMTKRYDIVVYNNDGTINVLVECKSTDVKISQSTFDQIARYNLSLKATILMITNGINHYYCNMDIENKKFIFLEKLPSYISNNSDI